MECTYWKFGAIVRQEKQRHDAGFVSTVEVFSVAASSPCCPHAQKTALGTFLDTPVVLTLARSLDEVINNIRNWLMGILAGLATLLLTVGGVRYLVASGDPGEVEKAKQAFKNAGFSYALAALAPVVVEILRGRTTRGTIARLFGRRTGAGGGDVPSAPGAMVTRRARPRSAPSSRAYETRDIGVQSVTS